VRLLSVAARTVRPLRGQATVVNGKLRISCCRQSGAHIYLEVPVDSVRAAKGAMRRSVVVQVGETAIELVIAPGNRRGRLLRALES
jgi:hypothetical protein